MKEGSICDDEESFPGCGPCALDSLDTFSLIVAYILAAPPSATINNLELCLRMIQNQSRVYVNLPYIDKKYGRDNGHIRNMPQYNLQRYERV